AFHDADKDGFGVADEPTLACAVGPGTGYSAKGGDCDDNDPEVYPGHAEICNNADDNCNGAINEGLPMVALYADDDRDGHGTRRPSDTQMFCGAINGWALSHDDCDDNNDKVHPGAVEICNGRDDDCDGTIDMGPNLCPTGEVCQFGFCDSESDPSPDPSSHDAGADGGSRDAARASDGSVVLRRRPPTSGCAVRGPWHPADGSSV